MGEGCHTPGHTQGLRQHSNCLSPLLQTGENIWKAHFSANPPPLGNAQSPKAEAQTPLRRDSRLLCLRLGDEVERTVLGWAAGGEHIYLLQSEEENAWVLGALCKHVRK